jgi:hypothetical protein
VRSQSQGGNEVEHESDDEEGTRRCAQKRRTIGAIPI